MRTLVVIPARYQSTRFPGKPLALLGGKPVIEWVWHAVATSGLASRAVVATDDERILHAVQAFGGEAMMTAATHRSGTDRCAEVQQRLAQDGELFDAVINVQGDEPFITSSTIAALINALQGNDIATLCTPITSTSELLSPNNVKVVLSRSKRALYFSRQPIPYLRGIEPDQWLSRHPYYKHLGLYGFAGNTLSRVALMEPGQLEQSESLEQLRWLENGLNIAVAQVESHSVGIDTPADLDLANQIITKKNK